MDSRCRARLRCSVSALATRPLSAVARLRSPESETSERRAADTLATPAVLLLLLSATLVDRRRECLGLSQPSSSTRRASDAQATNANRAEQTTADAAVRQPVTDLQGSSLDLRSLSLSLDTH